MIVAGDIYEDLEYKKIDGTTGPKLLFCIGCSEDEAHFVVCTSQPHGREENEGCNNTHRFPYYFCSACEGQFSKHTWLDLGASGFFADVHEVVKSRIEAGKVRRKFRVAEPERVLQCVMNGRHLTGVQRKLVQAAFSSLAPQLHTAPVQIPL